MKPGYLGLLNLLCVFVLSACALDQAQAAPPTKIATPFDRPGNIIWYPDGRLLLRDGGERELGDTVIRYWEAGADQILTLQLPEDPRCERFTEYLVSAPLPDGRLGFVEWCAQISQTIPEALGESYLVAYDWETGVVEQIVDGPLLDPGLSRNFSWNPAMTRGIQELTGLRGTIYWITPSGTEPIEATVTDGKRTWSLAENIRILQHPESETQSSRTDIGIAAAPAWTPDGNAISFFATLDAINRAGPSRADGEYRLYLMDPHVNQPISVLGGVYYPTISYWSPDSKWLAFVGRAGSLRRKGIWLFEPTRGTLVLAAAGEFFGIAWSPDGREIAADHCLDKMCRQSEIVKYDVSHLVSEEG